MNNDKLNRLKNQIKTHVPEIIILTTTAAVIVAALHTLKNQDAGEKLLALTNEEWEKLSSGDYIKVMTDAGMLYIAKEYHK